jgi:L-threonylcarbamoyladenylate synthase
MEKYPIVTHEQIAEAAGIIRAGGLVAFPTETVYGLGANALDAEAVAGIFAAKQRPSFDPLIVHIHHLDGLTTICRHIDLRVNKLAAAFWPGPLTIVLPKSKLIPDLVTSGLPDVAVRMPNHPVALGLIEAAGCPIAAPSANKFGKLSPTKAAHVRKQLPEIKCVLDGGNTIVGVESTVIGLEDDGFFIFRHGAITESMLLEYLPQSAKKQVNPLQLSSPGLMKSHYSPEIKMYILGEHPIPNDSSKAALLSFKRQADTTKYKLNLHLTENGDLREAAVRLFDCLHQLEDTDLDFIVVEPVPEVGIGIAVMDRLRKAAYRFHSNDENEFF